MTPTPTNDPAPVPKKPQAAPSPEALAALQSDVAAGRVNQRDAKALQTLLPFSNFLPAVWATNAMIGGLANRDTHKHRN